MANPDIKQTINQRGLGTVNSTANSIHVKVGLSSKGPVNSLQALSDPRSVVDIFGTGELVDAGATSLLEGGAPLLFVRAARDAAGVASAVTKTGTGSGILAVTGAAEDKYSVVVEIMQDGLITDGLGIFRYSLDGGLNFSGRFAIPAAASSGTTAEYPLDDTGLTLVFSDPGVTGFKTAAKYTFTTTAPTTTTENILAAINAALADQQGFAFIHVVGAVAAGATPQLTATAAVAMAATLGAQMAIAENAHRYLFVLMECPDIAKDVAKLAFANFVDPRVMVAYGMADYKSGLQDRAWVKRRSAAWGVSGRISRIAPGQDAAATEEGALLSVVGLVHNEGGAGDMDEARFTTLRSFGADLPGYYVHGARMMSEPNTDIAYVQHRRCMDIACRGNYVAMLPYLNSRLRVDKVTGLILEEQARTIDSNVTQRLRTLLVDSQDVTDVYVKTSRTENILSTSTLRTEVFIVPYGYARDIKTSLSFTNPALAQAGA